MYGVDLNYLSTEINMYSWFSSNLYTMGASTSAATDNFTSSESTSFGGGGVSDCCTDILHFSGVHPVYLICLNSTYTYTSNYTYRLVRVDLPWVGNLHFLYGSDTLVL